MEKLPGPGLFERVEVCRQHLLRAVQWKGERLGLIETRKHYTNYFKGIPDFKDKRIRLVTAESLQEVEETLQEIAQMVVVAA